MDEVRTLMEEVAVVEDPGGAADARLALKDGTRCTLGRDDPRFPVWLRLLGGALKLGTPVYVACRPGGPAETILPAAARRIESVRPAEGERAGVQIFMSPSLGHHLSTGHADYAGMRALLEQAVASEEPVFVAINPRTEEIVAVRRPGPEAKVIVI